MRRKKLTKSDKGWMEDGERDHVYLCIEVSETDMGFFLAVELREEDRSGQGRALIESSYFARTLSRRITTLVVLCRMLVIKS